MDPSFIESSPHGVEGDSRFLESLPEAHPIDTEVVLKEFFKSVSEATGPFSIAVAAGVAYNQLVGLEA